MFQTWGYSIVRSWRRDRRNKEFIRGLKRLRLRPAPAAVKPRSPA
jgi:hypothetical protein